MKNPVQDKLNNMKYVKSSKPVLSQPSVGLILMNLAIVGMV